MKEENRRRRHESSELCGGINSAQRRGRVYLRSGKRHNQLGRAMDGLGWRARLRGKLLYASLTFLCRQPLLAKR